MSDFLESLLLGDLGVLGPFTIYADDAYPELQLTDFLTGTVTLTGGYDNTPVDGDGIRLDVTANIVPEPSCVVLLTVGLACAQTLVRVGPGADTQKR